MTTPDTASSVLDRIANGEAPTCADSDLLGIAITRLQRAQARMQDHVYDATTWEHLEKAAEFLGWVATCWRRREAAVPTTTHPQSPEESAK